MLNMKLTSRFCEYSVLVRHTQPLSQMYQYLFKLTFTVCSVTDFFHGFGGVYCLHFNLHITEFSQAQDRGILCFETPEQTYCTIWCKNLENCHFIFN